MWYQTCAWVLGWTQHLCYLTGEGHVSGGARCLISSKLGINTYGVDWMLARMTHPPRQSYFSKSWLQQQKAVSLQVAQVGMVCYPESWYPKLMGRLHCCSSLFLPACLPLVSIPGRSWEQNGRENRWQNPGWVGVRQSLNWLNSVSSFQVELNFWD